MNISRECPSIELITDNSRRLDCTHYLNPRKNVTQEKSLVGLTKFLMKYERTGNLVEVIRILCSR